MAEEESLGYMVCRHRGTEPARIRRTPFVEYHRQRMVLHTDWQGRAESHGAHHKLARISFHSTRRVVGGKEGYKQRLVTRKMGHEMQANRRQTLG